MAMQGDVASTEAGATPDGDAWEPGLPPLGAIVPSALGGAVVPLAVYYLVRSHVGSDADALAIAGIPASLWVSIQFLRKRRIDPIGAIVLLGFVLGLIVSFAMGGSAFVLKVRDSGFTFVFGLASVISTRVGRRPLTFSVGRALSAGSDSRRAAQFDRLWDVPAGRATFCVLNLLWGFGLMCEAVTRVVLASELSTGSFVAVSPLISVVFLGSMGLLSAGLLKRWRHRGPLVTDVPSDGGSTWWWLRVYLGPHPVPAEA